MPHESLLSRYCCEAGCDEIEVRRRLEYDRQYGWQGPSALLAALTPEPVLDVRALAETVAAVVSEAVSDLVPRLVEQELARRGNGRSFTPRPEDFRR